MLMARYGQKQGVGSHGQKGKPLPVIDGDHKGEFDPGEFWWVPERKDFVSRRKASGRHNKHDWNTGW